MMPQDTQPASARQPLAYVGRAGEDLKASIERALDFIEWHRFVDKGARVFVKPNFTLSYYKEGVTTSPRFLRALLEILSSRAGKLIVGESDGGNHSFTAEQAFAAHDMYRMCSELGADLVNLSSVPAEMVEGEVLGKKVKVGLPSLLLHDVDCFVSAPVLKIHVITTVSVSLKNSWGCYPDTMRGLHHQDLSQKLALIARVLSPKLVVVDGTHALNRHGPMYGESVATNLVLAADNTVAADALAASVMGFQPEKIAHLALAERAGLGPARLDRVTLNQDWRQFRRQFCVQRTPLDRISRLLFCSDALARLVMSSPLTPIAYKLGGLLKSPEERELSARLKAGRQGGQG